MLIVQGLALNQLFSPFYLWPQKITLPEELLEPDEPLEYEVNLDPGPMGPTPKPAESVSELEPSAPAAQPASAPAAQTPRPAAQTPSVAASNAAPASAPVDAEPPPSPVQPATAVLSVSRSTPAPQPLLALEATPAPSAPEIVLVPSVDVAAINTTEQPAEERGAANGTAASSDATSTPVRPLAIEANAAPERLAAAPISILPGVQAPVAEPVIAAIPVATAARAIDRAPVDLTIAADQPVISEIKVPAPAANVIQPMRVKPVLPKPDLRVEQIKPSMAKPSVPVAVARPVLSRSDAASEAATNTKTPDLRIDAAVPRIATPSTPAAARPVLTAGAPSNTSASESVRLEVARDEITRPTMVVQAPITAADGQAPDNSAPNTARLDRSAAVPSAGVPSNASSSASKRGQSDAATGLPSDPFARAGSGKGARDLLGQGLDAAAAQVRDGVGDSYKRGNAFRRYSDPFADDAPNPLAGLRLREPQLFSDLSRFLVKAFGPAALGFAVGASGEIDDFSGPNAGVLIDQWIQQHHVDLQRECRMRQDTMDEHIRRLLCGEP